MPATPSPAIAALVNDDFANAAVISALPFTDSADLDGATVEQGEPVYCSYMVQTTWYVFTPASNVGVAIDIAGRDAGVRFIVGQVTFKAVTTIVGARDALPADNVAIALPTKVNP